MQLKIGMSDFQALNHSSFHKHDQWEIIFFIEGSGHLCTESETYPFKPGTIFFIPPELFHYSASTGGFKHIFLRGNFAHLIMFEDILTVEDNLYKEGDFLVHMIYRNRFLDNNYLSALCTTYIHFLLQEASFKNNIENAVHQICMQIAENAFDHNIDITFYLQNSGYAEDYIRMCFKEITGVPPLKFLTQLRMERAMTLIETYKDQVSLTQIAEKCGYTDYVYFSKKFKQQFGMSPQKYIHTFLVH